MAVVDLWTRPELVGGKVKRARTDQWGRGKRWLVRWRDGDDAQRKRRFTTRDEAEAFWVDLQRTPAERARGRTVGEQWTLWIAGKAGLSRATIHDYRRKWALYVEPEYGSRVLTSLTHAEVSGWAAGLAASTSPTTARRAYVVLSGIVRQAVRDGVMSADPTAEVSLPRDREHEPRFLTVGEVRKLAEECAPHGLIVWTLVLTGIRWGELAALEHADVDRVRGRIRVSKAATEVGGAWQVGPPKSGRARDVPAPAWLLEQMPEGNGPLFVTSYGRPWRQSSWKRIWSGPDKETPGARDRAGLPGVRVHDLRHTAASWAIASGADVKVVQRMLGHSSATLTVDRYGHLMDRGLDDVADRMGKMLGE